MMGCLTKILLLGVTIKKNRDAGGGEERVWDGVCCEEFACEEFAFFIC